MTIDSVADALRECARVRREIRRLKAHADPLLRNSLAIMERIVTALEKRIKEGAKA